MCVYFISRSLCLTSAAPGSLPATNTTWWNSPEPSIAMVQNLIDTFLSYSSDWGFFLDIENFRRDALLPLPIGHHSRPSPALLTTVYLIAIALSDSPALKEHEGIFLSRALSSLPASLSGIHPRKAIHALQAEILLSNYFYASGRFLEGRYHVTAAVSLAVGAVLFHSPATTLRPDVELIEAERVDACWATIILDKAWAVATDTPSNLQNSSELLKMPWPDKIWAIACEVAVEEIRALRTRLAWTQDVATSEESSLVALFAAAFAAMRRFETWPLLKWGYALTPLLFNYIITMGCVPSKAKVLGMDAGPQAANAPSKRSKTTKVEQPAPNTSEIEPPWLKPRGTLVLEKDGSVQFKP
ncbi:Zn(2)-C6 fungal-type domain-containing protein [Mycena sanguinolenta]|uniref:Zn(2)-C6 fungal-type domain-containing protein n=1 Tax=Mycena sanguinolenta TaxID=230812 RepID=A0A8H6XHT4_9AGAR|nr:Zn(2)-C6 fungal-type domain-containing protein [Mycena sanguinolenta]